MPGGINTDLIGARWVLSAFKCLEIARGDKLIDSFIDGEVVSIMKLAHHAAGLGSEMDTVPDGIFSFNDIPRLIAAIDRSLSRIDTFKCGFTPHQLAAIDSLKLMRPIIVTANPRHV